MAFPIGNGKPFGLTAATLRLASMDNGGQESTGGAVE
jgi:hypothetical protein